MVRSGIYTTEKLFMFLLSVKNYIRGVFWPGYKEWKSDYNPEPTGLLTIWWKCRLERDE
jgi:4-hydroxyphenylpyruvate dioxygenase